MGYNVIFNRLSGIPNVDLLVVPISDDRNGPVAVVLEYLHVQVSSISYKVVGSILALLGETLTAIAGDW